MYCILKFPICVDFCRSFPQSSLSHLILILERLRSPTHNANLIITEILLSFGALHVICFHVEKNRTKTLDILCLGKIVVEFDIKRKRLTLNFAISLVLFRCVAVRYYGQSNHVNWLYRHIFMYV